MPTVRKSSTKPLTPPVNEIAALAYHKYQERGCVHGGDLDDWLNAERELKRKRVSTKR